jgi:acetone carboxylase, gamma subunit
MSDVRQITEYLGIDLVGETWRCLRCDHEIGPARENYKHGLLLYDRDPSEVHPAGFAEGQGFSPDAEWCRIVEYYCPGCGTQVEVEYLPPGHPLTHDIEIDVDWLAANPVPAREAS